VTAKRGPFRAGRFEYASFLFTGLTGAATWLIVAMLAVILANVVYHGLQGLSWRFISTVPAGDLFDPQTTGVLPMILGTSAKVFLMTIFVMPVGVITAIYLSEYAHPRSLFTRLIRGAVNNLAGVPSILFG
jgi:phosphate transport system permease protein